MRKPFVLHPFLFAMFPVLFLFSRNVRSFGPGVMVLPIVVLLLATAALWGLSALVLRSGSKAGLAVSLLLVLFFSYGHAYRALPYWNLKGWFPLTTPKTAVFFAWVVLFVVGGWFAVRTRRKLDQFTRVVNVTAAVLVALSFFNIVVYGVSRLGASGEVRPAPGEEAPPAAVSSAEALPDIYYIVMDAYGRQDVLRDLYGFDNSGFLDYLKGKGFYVAEKSASNYAHTLLCLSSTLNLKYVQDLLPGADADSNNLMPLIHLTRYSEVRRFLKQRGYTVIAFSIGAAIAEMTNADLYLTPGWFADEFTNALVDMTPAWVLFQHLAPAEQHRRRLLYVFEHLVRVADRPGPKLVFAHLLTPHHPFVFGPNGEPVDPQPLNAHADGWLGGRLSEDYRTFYAEQLRCVNTKLKEAIDGILAKSARPPVIILQGDHGPRSLLRPGGPTPEAIRERFSILNAYYLPGKGTDDLRPDITPINSFRIVLNRYFGTNHEMLEGRYYYSTMVRPYDLKDVSAEVRGGMQAGPQGLP
ncbi:MAG TPA: hypothetical protein VMZ92_06610 [Planctomycetota bacterium]|nr:hypothetical protein [Planctomycetota bacterium]